MSTILHNSGLECCAQFNGLLNCGRVSGKRLKTVWFATSHAFGLFENVRMERYSRTRIIMQKNRLECVQIWNWIKCKVNGFSYPFNQWIFGFLNPVGCLGVEIEL